MSQAMLPSTPVAAALGPACIHCGQPNQAGSSFCEVCGKALPPAQRIEPRVIMHEDLADTRLGQGLQADELRRKAGVASKTLLAVTILQVVAGTLLGLIAPPEARAFAMIGMYVIAAIFLGLYLWARKSPFPAAIAGLVVFISLFVLDVVAEPEAAARGLLLRLIIIGCLINAIGAGARHRHLLKRMKQGREL
jgi:hypothetical protein